MALNMILVNCVIYIPGELKTPYYVGAKKFLSRVLYYVRNYKTISQLNHSIYLEMTEI